MMLMHVSMFTSSFYKPPKPQNFLPILIAAPEMIPHTLAFTAARTLNKSHFALVGKNSSSRTTAAPYSKRAGVRVESRGRTSR